MESPVKAKQVAMTTFDELLLIPLVTNITPELYFVFVFFYIFFPSWFKFLCPLRKGSQFIDW